MDTKTKIREVISQIDLHKSDYHWLADATVTLSTLLFNLGEEMSSARLLEEQTTIGFLDIVPEVGGKKMAVSEAQSRSLADTGANYDRLKTDYQSVTEIIYSLKAKLNNASQLARL